jgi:hypothetical protein
MGGGITWDDGGTVEDKRPARSLAGGKPVPVWRGKMWELFLGETRFG